MHNEKLTLANICGGAVQEKVNRALEKVAENILDPNTDAGKKRTITLKITLKPDEDDREDVEVNADVSYTLAADVGVATQFFVNKDLHNGTVSIMEHKKGEIRGQLDFSDMGYDLEDEEDTYEEEADDIEGGAEPEQKPVLDFRKHG